MPSRRTSDGTYPTLPASVSAAGSSGYETRTISNRFMDQKKSIANNQSTGLVWWCAFTILVSAFLLFQVQPMISKMVLPWFGGSPAVWSTCMLFFQVLLLAGYAYSHWLAKFPRVGTQAAIHVVLLAAATFLLPVVPHESWKPPDSSHPTTRILLLLGRNVGLPYFLLSSTGPLVQMWFSRACPGRSPYRLYSLSNVGSLGALLTYPFVFEPWLTTVSQGWMWSGAFVVFAVLCGGLAIAVARNKQTIGEFELNLIAASERRESTALPGLRDHLSWLGLAALGSTALLTVTNHLCEDVAVVPFMWVAPLSLYLVSFILCFESERWYSRRVFSVAAIAAIVVICVFVRFKELNHYWLNTRVDVWLRRWELADSNGHWNDNILWQAGAYLFALFCICMLCHGELVRRKPAPRQLTAFYLMTSAGGAAGGVLVALVCPRMFLTHFELNLTLLVSFALAASVWLMDSLERLSAPFAGPRVLGGGVSRALAWLSDTLVACRLSRPREAAAFASSWAWWRWMQIGLTCVLLPGVLGALLLVAKAQFESKDADEIATVRNFYGVLHVNTERAEDGSWEGRELVNGRILHGFQYTDESLKRKATTYYTDRSGVGVAFNSLLNERNRRVAVVGLGVGTMASYGERGDFFRFYEINPQVEAIARSHFSYLADSAAKTEVVLGDARLSMEHEEPQHFDLIVLDAFSSDAIPVHLLTVEAFTTYLRHLQPDGVIAVHTSNRHLDLVPVVVGLAKHHTLQAVVVDNDAKSGWKEEGSHWMLVTRSEEFLIQPEVLMAASPPTYTIPHVPLWTDQYSNLFEILKAAPRLAKLHDFFARLFHRDPEPDAN